MAAKSKNGVRKTYYVSTVLGAYLGTVEGVTPREASRLALDRFRREAHPAGMLVVSEHPPGQGADGDAAGSAGGGAEPVRLTPGVEQRSPTPQEEAERVAVLRATVAHYLPDFVRAVAKASEGDAVIILHQDAFAAGYHADEYTLLGMAVKYAGLSGVELAIIGKNHETF